MDFDVDALIDAIQSHQWQMVIALALIALVAFADGIAEEAGLTGRPLQVTSLVRGYVGGVAASLLGGVPWWVALIVGCGGVGVSRGARQLVVDGVRWLARKAGHGAVAGLLLVALIGAGCGAENRCLAERTTVTALGVALGMAEGLVPADNEEATQAMDIASASLLAGEVLVGSCEQIRDDSHNWRAWLTRAVGLVKAVIAIVRAAGVDVPMADTQVMRLEQLLSGGTPVARVEDYDPAYLD